MIKYDVVIIGSGLGGLQTAYILGKEGYNVCVLEQGKIFGGSVQSFVREGVIFDTGAHYIGAYDKDQSLHRYFDFFDLNDKLRVKRLDQDKFDVISFGDNKEYWHSIGFNNFSETLKRDFPGEKSAIDLYVKELNKIGDSFPMFNLGSELKYTDVSKYTVQSTSSFLGSITSNTRLQSVLAGANLLYAGEKNKTPLHIHGLISNSYIQSSYRFVGGSGQLANFLVDSIKSFGGTVLRNKKVVKINAQNGKIESLLTQDGELFHADNFISNVHPSTTFKLLPQELTKKIYFKRILGLEDTVSVFSLYIIFKENSFKYINHNVYYHTSEDVWVNRDLDRSKWPQSLLFLTQIPKGNSEFASGATVMSFMDYSIFSKWEGTEIENRPDEYNDLKKYYKTRLLDLLEERFPGIKSKIKSVYTSSPLTYKDYTGTNNGSIYGVTRDYKSPARSTILSNTKIPNLFLTGQNTNLHGVMGVTVGAVQTASKFVGFDYLLEKIRKN